MFDFGVVAELLPVPVPDFFVVLDDLHVDAFKRVRRANQLKVVRKADDGFGSVHSDSAASKSIGMMSESPSTSSGLGTQIQAMT